MDFIYGKNVESEYPLVKTSIERITPEKAEEMLAANVRNRRPKKTTVAKAIQRGEWVLNGETIVFSSDGVLIDGQNRLMAIAASGTPCDVVVVRGVERSAQLTIDVGAKRRLSDYLEMDGYKAARNVAAIGTALLMADKHGIDSHYVTKNNYTFTINELYDFTTSAYETRIAPILNQTTGVARLYKLRVALFAPLFDVFRRIDYDSFDEFASQMKCVTVQCQPVQKLSHLLMLNRDDRKGSLATRTIAAYTVKVWNAYMQGEELPFLRFILGGAHPEAFPAIFGCEQVTA